MSRWNDTPRRRQAFRAAGRRHSFRAGWCVHCGHAIEPCKCRRCTHQIAGPNSEPIVIAVWMGDEISHLPREFRWMHERCIARRATLRDAESVVMPINSPPACVVDLTDAVERITATTSVMPARHADGVTPVS